MSNPAAGTVVPNPFKPVPVDSVDREALYGGLISAGHTVEYAREQADTLPTTDGALQMLARHRRYARLLPLASTAAAADVLMERERQQAVEGWTLNHDDEHDRGELGLAAALYALPYESGVLDQDDFIRLHMLLDLTFGWNLKPEPDRRKRLVKAAALILAEIERLDRETMRSAR